MSSRREVSVLTTRGKAKCTRTSTMTPTATGTTSAGATRQPVLPPLNSCHWAGSQFQLCPCKHSPQIVFLNFMSVAFQTKSPLLVKRCFHRTEQTFERGIQTVVNLRIWHLFSGILCTSTRLLKINMYLLIYFNIYLFIPMQVTNYLILLSLQ